MIFQFDAAEILNLSSYGRPRPFPDYSRKNGGIVLRIPESLSVQHHMYQAEKTKGKIYPSIHWEEAAPLRGGDYLFQYQKPCVPTSFWEYMLQDDEQAAPAAMIAVAQLCCHFLSQADPLEGMSSWAAEATGGYRLVVGWASTGKIVPNALWDNGRPTYVGLATIRRLA